PSSRVYLVLLPSPSLLAELVTTRKLCSRAEWQRKWLSSTHTHAHTRAHTHTRTHTYTHTHAHSQTLTCTHTHTAAIIFLQTTRYHCARSEERRVGTECRSR